MQTKDWFHEWLEHYVKPASKQKTYILYCELTEQHILPKFGEMELEGITPLVLQRYISELMEHGNLRTGGGLSASSVNAIITVIQSSLKVAYNLGYLEAYTADKVKRPKIQEKQIECFTPAEQKKIEQAVLTDKRPKMFGIILCLYTGLRIGELLALEWSDIDFSKGELTVSKTSFSQIQFCEKLLTGPLPILYHIVRTFSSCDYSLLCQLPIDLGIYKLYITK